MKNIKISEETFQLIKMKRISILQDIHLEPNKKFEIPTDDEVIKKMQEDMEYVNDENAKLINQLLLAEIKPFYMDQKHFDETKDLRDKQRKLQGYASNIEGKEKNQLCA